MPSGTYHWSHNQIIPPMHLSARDDVKFAYDIGTSLLTEVRRLQSLLNERDKTIQDMKADKDDLEKENDLLRINLRQQETAADRFKEDNWNLEVKIQEATAALKETQQTAARAESELKRTTRQLTRAREAAENHKSEHEKVSASYDKFKTKHETNVAQTRKQAAALTCEKSDLQASLDTMKTEMAKREPLIGKNHFGSPLGNNNPPAEVSTPTNYHNDEDFFTSALASRTKLDAHGSAFLTTGHAYDFGTSPDPSPTKPGIVLTRNHPSNELETLKQALGHAHRQIGTLKNTIQREKEQKLQFKKQSPALGRMTKFTAPNKERHDIWYTALKYLLDRPSTVPVDGSTGGPPARPIASPHQRRFSEDGSHGNLMTSSRSPDPTLHPKFHGEATWNTSCRVPTLGGRGAEEPTRSARSYRQSAGYADDDDDYEAVDSTSELSFELNYEGFEAMENVRACCDGEHDLGTLSRRPGSRQHHHHHHHHHNGPPGNVSRPQTPAERPTSPSGWSFRSKTSGHSEGGSCLSQWAADTKRSIRFTNRGKSPATRPSLNIPRTNNWNLTS
ncbi:hypothetical protein M407DRAFT_33348 [Tulasnella calospora MUT 4182]|uniref:Uncharacterized protein n=1 Tax=Tulasnella calospora MUT 4182 TaxID=1051891 RepID=A0A0C3PQX5_9AGAM|nr:hypothetical protein M407DRAFT_33348 [Tulasnella calospora MUT 4182]